MLDTTGQALAAELVSLFGRGVDTPLSDADFDALARRIFAYQFERNAPYAAYCRSRGRLPETVAHWLEIPAVPTAAFKEVHLVSGDERAGEALFRTSGTTLGGEKRGEHVVLDLSLYHASLLPNFAAHLLPEGLAMPILSLIPSTREMPDSSLAHMVAVVIEQLGGEGSGYYATVERGIDGARLEAALRRAEGEGTPVCLLGTSFSYVHWTDALRAEGTCFRLPPGSRLMDTGGFKGKSREVGEGELRASYAELLGIDPDFTVNEYGMTEMCSQFYDNVLRDRVRAGAAAPRHKVAPPWVRTVVVSPETLEPLPAGEVGILRHVDLANLGSVTAIQTEDLGREVEGGFLVLGRAAGAAPRGCSIAVDLLLRALAERAR